MELHEAIRTLQDLCGVDFRAVGSRTELGLLLLSLMLPAEDLAKWDRVVSSALNRVMHDAPMMSEAEAWSALWKQGPLVEGDDIKPDSIQFVRDSLPRGEKRPDEESRVKYTRPSDQEIWKRHCLELKTKAYVQYLEAFIPAHENDRPVAFAAFKFTKFAKGSSLLMREEAKSFLRFGNLPRNLRRIK